MKNVQEMMGVLAKEKPASIRPALQCVDRNGKPVFGIVYRSAVMGKHIVSILVNVRNDDTVFAAIAAQNAATSGTNLLTGRPGSGLN